MARDNRTIGKFHLTGLPPAPRGVPQIEVGFDIDANGILNVAAKDLGTGKEQNITITASSGLSDKEVEKMVSQAKEHESEDKKKREEIDTRNQADAAVYQTEKLLKENGDKIGAEARSRIEAAIGRVKEALKKEDTAEIKSAAEALNQSWHAASEEMYRQATASAQAAQPGPGEPQSPPPGASQGAGDQGEVIDADFEVDGEDRPGK